MREESRLRDETPASKVEIEKVYPLSPMQEGMLFLSLLEPDSGAYVERFEFSLEGGVEPPLLEQAFQLLVKKHDILRTVFVSRKVQKPRQVVLKNIVPSLPYEDISHLDLEARQRYLEAFKRGDDYRRFNLEKYFLIRAFLFKTGSCTYRLFWGFHHILMDGWSTGLVFKDFLNIYASLRSREPGPGRAGPSFPPYKEYISFLERQDKEQGLRFWQHYLDGLDTPTRFPRLARYREGGAYEPAAHACVFDPGLSRRLFRLAREQQVTVNTCFQALWALLLGHYNPGSDVVFGAVVSGRPAHIEQVEKMVGLFINTIPVRIKPEAHGDFNRLIRSVQQDAVSCKPHEYLPLAEIQARTSLKERLIHHVVGFENFLSPRQIEFAPDGAGHEQGLGFRVTDVQFRSYTNYDFTLNVAGEDRLTVKFTFNARVYEPWFMEKIGRELGQVARQVIGQPTMKLAAVEVVTPEEKREILAGFNGPPPAYPAGKLVHRLFEEQVALHRDRVAVKGPDSRQPGQALHLSYSCLNRQANRVAHLLRAWGLGRGEVVALLLDRTPDLTAAIFGVLKAGGAYLPLGLDIPLNRLLHILEDAAVACLISKSPLLTPSRYPFTALQDLQHTHSEPLFTPPRAPIDHLDVLPMPHRSLVDYDRYAPKISLSMVKNCITLQGTRGCPYRCAYCARLWPQKQAVRSAEHIFAEVKHYYDMGVRRFSFIDDIFNLDRENSSRFFRLIVDKRMDIQILFPGGLRGDILAEDYIDLMVEAGTIHMSLALETASPRLQKLIRKNLDIGILERNLHYICRRYPGVILDLFTMHGLPTETEEEAKMTLDFIKSIRWLHFPLVNITRIYPNTDMEKLAIHSGVSRQAILRAENLPWHEGTDISPFDRQFTTRYQTDFLNNYFLLQERLLHVLPHQLEVLTEDEMVQKYRSYLPTDIRDFDELLEVVGISRQSAPHLAGAVAAAEARYAVPHLDRKIKRSFPVHRPAQDALPVLLLDLSQFYTGERQLLDQLFDPPLGLLYLLTWLQREYGSRVNGRIAKSAVDFDSDEELKKLIDDFRPRVIGIRALTYYKHFFHRTVNKIRHWGFTGPIIAGGPYATNGCTSLLQDRNIDLVVLREGEITFSQLIGEILKQGGRLPPQETLRTIPGLAFIPGPAGEKTNPARRLLLLDELRDVPAKTMPEDNPGAVNRAQDPAYAIFTSGSSGIPKGVVVRHFSLHNLVRGLGDQVYRRCAHSSLPLHIALVSPYGFDASVKQFFAALLLGHTLHIVPEETRVNGFGLMELFRRHHIQVTDGTPTHLKLLLASGLKDAAPLPLEHLLIGGEALSRQTVKEFFDACAGYPAPPTIVNLYGPSECTVDAAACHLRPGQADDMVDIPIGRPLPNHQLFILDTGSPGGPWPLSAIGAAGELCIGGQGLAAGYLNRVEATAEAFVPHPFVPGERLYRSGDLALWQPDGHLRYLGRRDQQVKIRGYRLELGEIESQLRRHQKVADAVVMVRTEADGGDVLCGVIVPVSDSAFGEAADLSESLRRYLADSLADYMIPSFFIQVEQIPLTANGKLDRRALLQLDMSGAVYRCTAPRDECQQQLVRIWAEVLKIDAAKIGIDTSFFDLGGHSLKATIMVSRIHKELDVQVPLEEVFSCSTIRGLAAYIKAAAVERFIAIEAAEERSHYLLSSAQKRLYIQQQMQLDNISYNLSIFVILEGEVERERLEQIFNRLIRRHESFRTAFEVAGGEPVQRICRQVDFQVLYIHPGPAGQPSPEAMIREFVRPFDLAKPPLLRVGLSRLGEQTHLLMLDMHHIVSDGTSLGIMIREFMALYGGETLSPLPLRYRDFAGWQDRLFRSSSFQAQRDYWLNQLQGEIPALRLGRDYPRPTVRTYSGGRLAFEIEPGLSKRVKQLAARTGTTLFMVLSAVYNILLFKYTGQQDMVVGCGVAGRRHADLESIVGIFINILALRNRPRPQQTFLEFLQQVKETTVFAFDNQDYPYEELVRELGRQGDAAGNPLFETIFQVQNLEVAGVTVPGLRLKPYAYESEIVRFDLIWYAIESADKITLQVSYGSELYRAATIQKMGERYLQILSQVVENNRLTLEAIDLSAELARAGDSALRQEPGDFDF
jgi:amino acid adenylation domain-containing protein